MLIYNSMVNVDRLLFHKHFMCMCSVHSDVEARRSAECKIRSDMKEGELDQWRQEVDAYNRQYMTKAEETAQVVM